jgi:acyl transferase domain-containing protein
VAINPETGRQIGVFTAISTTDYHRATLWRPEVSALDMFTASGASFAAAAGRLAYSFGFTGPCLTVDTACSSSLVAIHLACQSLRHGECEAALVAGVNALLAPNLYVCLSQMGLMSRHGQCRAFDASGDGYVRAEGCGAVVLKTLDQAQRDGNRILALIRASAVNQDGRTASLTAPSGKAQIQVIGQALAAAGLAAGDIDYVEAHGTGTPLGDAVELNALAATYAQGRDRSSPLLVGSVKTAIGHLEAGAGMAGLIKTIQCLSHAEIPPHLHLQRPTPHFDWDEAAISVPVEPTPWPDTGRARRAAVSSFGFSGTNAHVILEAAPDPVRDDKRQPAVSVLPISARTKEDLETLASELAVWLEAEPRDLADAGFTLGAGRTVFAHRRAVVGADCAELASGLRGARPARRADDPLRSRLQGLADLWSAGQQVDWQRLYRPYGAGIIDMPGHPFRRQDFWIAPASAPEAVGPIAAATRPLKPSPVKPDGIQGWRSLILGLVGQVLSDRPQALTGDRALVEQGLTSLLALELRRLLETALERPIPATFIYNYPTVDRMAGFFCESTGRAADREGAAVRYRYRA